jgi:hypothetical protein
LEERVNHDELFVDITPTPSPSGSTKNGDPKDIAAAEEQLNHVSSGITHASDNTAEYDTAYRCTRIWNPNARTINPLFFLGPRASEKMKELGWSDGILDEPGNSVNPINRPARYTGGITESGSSELRMLNDASNSHINDDSDTSSVLSEPMDRTWDAKNLVAHFLAIAHPLREKTNQLSSGNGSGGRESDPVLAPLTSGEIGKPLENPYAAFHSSDIPTD